ncbi:MAG: 50S ribosomal protein L11 [Patescibacteria group bacterium]|jgi:large subunit ribosomal protein L11|nr:50S ribosomal protein L11 [Patescibacteria group bacterium]
MAVKKVKANLKLKLKAGQASAGPPVGSTLGQYGVNMMDFVNPFNSQTKDLNGKDVTAHITIYEDKTMSFRVVGTPTDDLIRNKLSIDKGSGKPNSEKITKKLTSQDLEDIAKIKAEDMNSEDIKSIMKMVAGTARSMGVEIEE